MTKQGDEGIGKIVDRWARLQFGAPRHLSDLIIESRSRDQVVERLYTEIVRRELGYAKAPTSERRATISKIDPAQSDLFSFTTESLRVASEHIAECETCNATGQGVCSSCAGKGAVRCGQCGGAGSFRNPSTNRMNQCKQCKKTGMVGCGTCGGDGRVNCWSCRGSGHALAWFTFTETTRFDVRTLPESTLTIAHPFLKAERALVRGELDAFTVDEFEDANGPLSSALGTVRNQLETIQPRFEKVERQQYVRIKSVMRDVRYRMCGTDGAIVLSGNELTPATTSAALRPIKRRTRLFIGTFALLVGGLLAIWFVLHGKGAYFDAANTWSCLALGAAAFLAVPAIAGYLRSWQGGLSFKGTKPFERGLGSLAGACAIASIAIVVLVRPSIEDVDTALSSGEVARAREIVAALKALGDSKDVRDADDRVTLAEAARLTGEQRLGLLDRVSRNQGDHASQASMQARADRLAHIRAAVQAGNATEALASIDKWFSKQSDPEVLEEKAKAFEARAASCSNPACSYELAVNAVESKETTVRAKALTAARDQLLATLSIPDAPAKDTLAQLRVVRGIEEIASKTSKLPGRSTEIDEKLKLAVAWIESERAKVPLLGADFDVSAELLIGLKRIDARTASVYLDGGLKGFLSLDSSGKCRGFYVVGDPSTGRIFGSATWPLTRLVGQSIGRAAVKPPAPQPVTRWYDGSVPITARYDEGNLVELRIGDAGP